MKTNFSKLIVTAILGLLAATLAAAAMAEECKVLGSLTRFEFAADGKSAQAIVKNSKTGKDTMLTIADELTLSRYRNKPMAVGTEVRAHFEQDDKNTCYFLERAVGGHDRGDGAEYFVVSPKN